MKQPPRLNSACPLIFSRFCPFLRLFGQSQDYQLAHNCSTVTKALNCHDQTEPEVTDFSEAVLSQAFLPSEPSLSVSFCGLVGEHAVSKILFSSWHCPAAVSSHAHRQAVCTLLSTGINEW